ALVVGPVAGLAVDLGGQHDLVPPAAAVVEPAPQDLLGDPLAQLPAVYIGGVEEVEAVLECPVHDGVAVGLGRLRPEVHRAQAQPAHPQTGATQIRVFHGANSAMDRASRPAGVSFPRAPRAPRRTARRPSSGRACGAWWWPLRPRSPRSCAGAAARPATVRRG